MNRVDADRIKRMPPDTFGKFLPYAIAGGRKTPLGASLADGIIKDPPTWYVSPNGYVGFSPLFFFQLHAQHGVRHSSGGSPPRPEPVPLAQASAEAAVPAEVTSPEEDSAEAAAAPSSLRADRNHCAHLSHPCPKSFQSLASIIHDDFRNVLGDESSDRVFMRTDLKKQRCAAEQDPAQ